MFSVIFEVHPRTEHWDAYLDNAKSLRPDLERIAGFIDNVRYRSLTRDGWILSLSNWRDEKSLIRWRTQVRHHQVQEKGRAQILADYHLRVGQVTKDTHVLAGYALQEQRLDETDVGQATAITLINAARSIEGNAARSLHDYAERLGLKPWIQGSTSWDVFDAVLAPGNVILLVSWRDNAAAAAYEDSAGFPEGTRVRRVRVIRDYGMFDRREAPQYYPDAAGAETIHS
jgi:heme-degrading monooxygenase HmoA